MKKNRGRDWKTHARQNKGARSRHPTHTETSAVPEHDHNNEHKPLWNEVKFIDRDLYHYTRRVKEAIHRRLYPDNINRDGGIEISEAWMPTIKNDNDNDNDKEFI